MTEEFAEAVQQSLGAKSSVVGSCMSLSLERPEVVLSGLSKFGKAPAGSRKLILAGWLHCVPAATSIDFRDMEMIKTEAGVVDHKQMSRSSPPEANRVAFVGCAASEDASPTPPCAFPPKRRALGHS